ncbi:SDR family oxidoreductase [Actinomadura luteofluorescens]
MRGRVALVTGAAGGVGSTLVRELAGRGWRTAGLDLRRAPDADHSVSVDVAEPAQVRAAVRRIERELGPIEAAVFAAGHHAIVPVSDIAWPDWRRMLRVHLGGVVNVCAAVGPGMAERGFGRLIHIASQQAFRASVTSGAYGVSKAGLVALARSQAEAWSPRGVTANALVPGFVMTPLNARLSSDPAKVRALAERTMTGRNGLADDFAGAAVFLASPSAAYVTGQSIFVDGGFSAH